MGFIRQPWPITRSYNRGFQTRSVAIEAVNGGQCRSTNDPVFSLVVAGCKLEDIRDKLLAKRHDLPS